MCDFIRRVPGELDVLVGVTSFITPTSEQQNIPVLSIVPHADYDSSTKLNDIALISVSSFYEYLLIYVNSSIG